MTAVDRPARVRLPQRGSAWSGWGTVFAKTLRDSRLAISLVGGVVALLVCAGGVTMVTTYGTQQARDELGALSTMLPAIMRGLYGDPVRVDTLGGFISWHYGAYLALLMGLWSIMALSATIAAEARLGSLDVTLSAALSRRRVATEKVLGHVAGLAIVVGVIAVAAWLTGVVGARFPGDEIPPLAAVGFAVGLAVKGLIAGSIAFVLAAMVGRGTAAGLAGAAMLAGYLAQGYRTVVPTLDLLAPLSWFAWSADHLPLAGQLDWPAFAVIAIVSVGMLALGIELFVRRDIGVSAPVSLARWPSVVIGVGGPVRRNFGELLPAALAWGVGLGLYGLVMAASARAFTDLLAGATDLLEAVRRMIPDVDLSTMAGFLQFAFSELGFLLIALAAATLVGVWHSDETAGRLELLLASPLSRVQWTTSGSLAVWLSIALATALFSLALGAGIASTGSDPATPMVGMAVLGLYAAALAGIGTAIGGLFGPAWAARSVFALALADFLADVLAPALGAPEWVEQLALTAHLGKPMIGTWDIGGIVACAVLAVGGLLVGAWGMRRRDLQGD